MAKCIVCQKSVLRIQLIEGTCFQCLENARAAAAREIDERRKQEAAVQEEARKAILSRIQLTTESTHNLPVRSRLAIITAEVVIGMHLFKDIASAFRDTFGGRSETMQNGLREARITALEELRLEAAALGADAVVGVDLDYSEISGGGKSMLFLVASGTAVTLYSNSEGPHERVLPNVPDSHADRAYHLK
jgi:uncharacterized protein YbjQ (UPF0145 family)